MHKAMEDSVFLKRFIPQNLGEVLNPGQEVERLDHLAGGTLRLGAVGTEQFHTAPKDGVDETVSEEGEGGGSGEGEEHDEGHVNATTPGGHRHEDREAKNVRYTLHHHGAH